MFTGQPSYKYKQLTYKSKKGMPWCQTINQQINAFSGDNQPEMCFYKLQWHKMLNWRCVGLQGFKNKPSFLNRMMRSSKENTTWPKLPGNLMGRGSELAASFKLSQKKASSHPDWLGPISIKLLPLLHQVSVRCTQVDSGTSAQIKEG